MSLEQILVALVNADDLRPLVRAICACARRQLPAAQRIDPFNVTIVETAEAWANGERTLVEVRAVRKRARDTRGGFFTSVCVAAIVDDRRKLDEDVRLFARQIPFAVWSEGEAGRRWKATAGPRTPVGESPAALAEIAAVQGELCALVERVAAT